MLAVTNVRIEFTFRMHYMCREEVKYSGVPRYKKWLDLVGVGGGLVRRPRVAESKGATIWAKLLV
jgi:hypothetical protein